MVTVAPLEADAQYCMMAALIEPMEQCLHCHSFNVEPAFWEQCHHCNVYTFAFLGLDLNHLPSLLHYCLCGRHRSFSRGN